MYQPFDLSGRAAVVTGGNGGIGLGMARALLAAGAKVAIWGSNPDKTERAKAQLSDECGDPTRVHAFVCDVGDEAQVDAAFAASVAALGNVHACFANAGVSSKGTPMVDMSLEEFRRVQRINVEGVFLTFRAAARHMAVHGQGGALVRVVQLGVMLMTWADLELLAVPRLGRTMRQATFTSAEDGGEHLEGTTARRLADGELGVHEVGRSRQVAMSVKSIATMGMNFLRQKRCEVGLRDRR